MNSTQPIRWAAAAGVLAVVVLFIVQVVGRAADPPLPSILARYVDERARLTADEKTRMRGGSAVTKLLDADASAEIAICGIVWVAAPVDRYLAAVRDIERLEKGGGFLMTKRISNPPRPEDFEPLVLPGEDIADLRDCRIGACDLKLGAAALGNLQKTVDWSRPSAADDVNKAFRTLALKYVTGYLEGGNSRLAVYRDSDRPTFVAKEFESLVARMPTLTEERGDVRRYLLDYPAATLPDAESFLYWQETSFGLKPTIRISHLTIAPQSTGAIVASKMLYASHYFWTALEVRALIPDPARGEGFWFVNVNRSRSDGLSGFKGKMVRGRVQAEAQKGMEAALQLTKRNLEQGAVR